MIEKMEKLFIYGLSQDTASLVKELMKCGCLEITDPRLLDEKGVDLGLTEKGSSELYQIEQNYSRISATLNTLAPHIPSKSFFAPAREISFNQLEDKGSLDEALGVCDMVEAVQKELADLKSQQGRIVFVKDSLKPWLKYDLPLKDIATKTSKIQLMTVPAVITMEEMNSAMSAENLVALVEEISVDKDMHYIALLAHETSFTASEDLLRQFGASRISFSDLTGTVSEELANCKVSLKELSAQIKQKEIAFEKLADHGDLLKLVHDGLNVQADCEKASQQMLHTSATSVIGGWIPVNKKADIEAILKKYICYYEYLAPENIDETPVLLKNNKFVQPFECVTEMYSLPASTGYDPNAAMAPFFFVFFGMMLSDAGYGLLLMIGGFVGAKLLKGNKLLKMLGYCGISTIIWGFVYGSFFGDALTQISRTFFDVDFALPIFIDPQKDTMVILVMSFAMGAIHLFTGMGIKAYIMIKRGHPWQALFDVGFWYFLLIGLPLTLVGGVVGQVGMYFAIAGAIGLVLTQGRDKKNIVMKFLGGVISLYGITGYFSDVLSYSRIMALGLATGVIATVVNTMGAMVGNSFIGVIVFVMVFIFGHTLNLAINALGSYVHTSRLQYVEFFGKFFEGGGKAFNPLKINTQYVNVNKQEDI